MELAAAATATRSHPGSSRGALARTEHPRYGAPAARRARTHGRVPGRALRKVQNSGGRVLVQCITCAAAALLRARLRLRSSADGVSLTMPSLAVGAARALR